MTPIVALLYDFDKTLCTTDMEDYAFIPALGYTPAEFWKKANDFGRENRMDGLLAYMYTMIAECRAQNIRLDREFLVRCGHSLELFPGVADWFGRINAFGRSEAGEADREKERPGPDQAGQARVRGQAGVADARHQRNTSGATQEA